MKKIFLISVTLFVFFASACNNNTRGNGNGNGNGNTEGGETKVYNRNLSITPENAYNNLFLDSAALENYISNQNTDPDVADRMRSFYNDRNFEFAWFAPDAIAEQGREFWSLYSYSISSLKDSSFFIRELNKKMPAITSADSIKVQAGDTSFIRTELMLTEAFLHYIMKDGKDISNDLLQQYIPAKKDDLMHAVEVVLSSKDQGGQNEDAIKAFASVKDQLKIYYDIAKKGGWQSIAYNNKKIKKGSKSTVIPAIKRRLMITGELQDNDTTAIFDGLLDSAVKNFQVSHGYTPDGIVTDSLIKDMNVTAEKRVEQLLINLNRIRWMPAASAGRFIITNIPEYKLHVYEDKTKMFDMDVVVGKEGSGTVIFTGNLTEIVFSPYWNLPMSIIKKEIMPKMEEDKNYLAEQQMEITGYSNGTPIIRQLPGPKNSLGRVKFLFHNSYNIYFHDTPAKSLFNKDKRAYSHGCIRLADPVKMANYLLEDNEKWTPEKITEAMKLTTEKYVTLKHSVPVLITYYTAWVDETGRLNLRDDIYQHDNDVAQKMFTNP